MRVEMTFDILGPTKVQLPNLKKPTTATYDISLFLEQLYLQKVPLSILIFIGTYWEWGMGLPKCMSIK